MRVRDRRRKVLIAASSICILLAAALASTGCALFCVERPIDVTFGSFALDGNAPQGAFDRLRDLTGAGLEARATASVHNHNFLSISIDGVVVARLGDCVGTLFTGTVRDVLPARRSTPVVVTGHVRVDGEDVCSLRRIGSGCADGTSENQVRVRSTFRYKAGPKSGTREMDNDVPLPCDMGF
jgi:hypothetical protein